MDQLLISCIVIQRNFPNEVSVSLQHCLEVVIRVGIGERTLQFG